CSAEADRAPGGGGVGPVTSAYANHFSPGAGGVSPFRDRFFRERLERLAHARSGKQPCLPAAERASKAACRYGGTPRALRVRQPPSGGLPRSAVGPPFTAAGAAGRPPPRRPDHPLALGRPGP